MDAQIHGIPTPELLAPAGGPDALRAAVNNGADAVYLGLAEFNARRGAENFDLEGLAEACRYAHLRGVRVYLTVNVLVRGDELPRAVSMIDEAWARGVDAVIVQDLGLLAALRGTLPEVRVHASTQIDAHNVASVRTLAVLGVSRVTLARETAVSEIGEAVASGAVEIESFVHGALCMSYSGQCLLSSVAGGRSANRGVCAQPCRLRYELSDASGALAATDGAHLLSPCDLAALDVLPDLVRAGVTALKIEGRMKSAEYVALVTGVYRRALDRAVEDPEGYAASAADWAVLEEAFSRGFSPAYLTGVRDDGMMSRRRPNNRGVLVGRITSVSGSSADIDFERAVEAADTVEVWTSEGRFAQRLGAMAMREGEAHAVPAGATASVRLESRARAGDRVFRVASAALLDAARRTLREDHEGALVPVDVAATVVTGRPLEVRLSARGSQGAAVGEPVEAARTKAVTAHQVIEHVGRFGGTAFRPVSWDVQVDPTAGIAFSRLHSTRREAVGSLERALLEPWADRHVTGASPSAPRRATASGRVSLIASAWDADVAAACMEAGADRVLLRAEGGVTVEGAEPLLPRVAHGPDVDALVSAAVAHGSATVGNLGVLREAVAAGVAVEADWPLGVFNGWTAECLAGLGAQAAWASPELSGPQLAALVAASPIPVGTLAYGRVEVMVTEHCVLQAAGPCSGSCATCARRADWWTLRDDKGFAFPVRSDPQGRSHVVNSVPLDLARAMQDVTATGVAAVRLEFTIEEPAEAARVVRAFRAGLGDVAAGRALAGPVIERGTTGHFFRGVR